MRTDMKKSRYPLRLNIKNKSEHDQNSQDDKNINHINKNIVRLSNQSEPVPFWPIIQDPVFYTLILKETQTSDVTKICLFFFCSVSLLALT